MLGMNSDQLHRSTLGIYSSLMNEFNPSLQKLVSLGNSYIQAFKTLAVASDAYFSALSKIGEQAFHTVSSRSIGDVLIQISERQRRLTLELEGVFRLFSTEVLEAMNNNIRLDRDYLSSSRATYEVELRNQAAALERLRRRSSQAYPQGGGNVEYVEFLKESYSQALQEEERRYRFLAEKHCGMTQSIAKLMNKNGGTLQEKAAAWTEEVDATRRPEAQKPATLDNSVGMKEEGRGRKRDEVPLGKIPSRAPSPEGSVLRFGADSAGGGGGGRVMRARVAHQPAGSNPTLLPFTRGQIITVLVQQPRNGWLFGRADNSSRQGWFPASFLEAVDDLPMSPVPRPTPRSNSSMSSQLNQPRVSSQSGAAPPPPPPPPPQSPSLSKHANMPPAAPSLDKRAMSNSEKKRSQLNDSRPELFPKGTNPFATVKLKPTSTNDRSAPRLYRR